MSKHFRRPCQKGKVTPTPVFIAGSHKQTRRRLLQFLAGRMLPNSAGDYCNARQELLVVALLIRLIYSIISAFDEPLFNIRALTEYILYACQHPKGGLIDKPGK